MKVKIGSKIFDSTEQPIMLILSDVEKENIENMSPDDYQYCSFPSGSNQADIIKFMEVCEEEQ